MKCALCKTEIGIVYLDKIAGTVIKDAKGKRFSVCASCQIKYANDKEKMLEAMGE